MQKTILSTADVARLFNVTETTVKRWADDGELRCQKTLGGHRKFVIKYVIEFAEKNNMEPLGTLSAPKCDRDPGRLQLAVLERNMPELTREYVDRALDPLCYDMTQFFSYLYEHKIPLWQIFDDVVTSGMSLIGEKWANGEIGVEQEHTASYETLEALARLSGQIRLRPPTGHTAVLSCLGSELHEMGLRCSSYLFASEGWRTLYLGAQTPVDGLFRCLARVKPDILCLSASRDSFPANAVATIKSIVSAAHAVGTVVLLGGRAVQGAGEAAGACDLVVSNSRELLGIVNQWDTLRESLL